MCGMERVALLQPLQGHSFSQHQHVELLNEQTFNEMQTRSSCNIMALLYWFSKARGSLKYKYDALDSKWMNADSIFFYQL